MVRWAANEGDPKRSKRISGGLSGEVSSGDVDRELDIATRMRTGNVTMNGKSHFGVTSPLGGAKQSGLGYRNGECGFQEYLAIKTIGLARVVPL